MNYLILLIGVALFGIGTQATAQRGQFVATDSFSLQRITVQDTFLLRAIPNYISYRKKTPGDEQFQTTGVIVVTIPLKRVDSLIQYQIRTEYDDYGLKRHFRWAHPLFYGQIAGRWVVICDQWTGSLVSLSASSQRKVFAEFAIGGWLKILDDDLDTVMEIESRVYPLRRPTAQRPSPR